MVFKASRKINRVLKTRVSLLLLVCLTMPAASNSDDIEFTSMTITSINLRHCGHVMLATDASNIEIRMSPKLRNPNKDLRALKKKDIKILKRVRTQLQVAKNHYHNKKDMIAQFYSEVKAVMRTDDYHYEWLPSQPLNWYKEHASKLNKNAKVLILLPLLRDSLHNFSVTLEQMRMFSETDYMSNSIFRKQTLDELSKHLIAVLCEVETALLSMSLWRAEKKTPDGARTVTVGGPGWDPNPDHTAMLIQDWGVLTIYYRFLKDWLQISEIMVRDVRCVRRHKCGDDSSKHKRRRKSSDFVT